MVAHLLERRHGSKAVWPEAGHQLTEVEAALLSIPMRVPGQPMVVWAEYVSCTCHFIDV